MCTKCDIFSTWSINTTCYGSKNIYVVFLGKLYTICIEFLYQFLYELKDVRKAYQFAGQFADKLQRTKKGGRNYLC